MKSRRGNNLSFYTCLLESEVVCQEVVDNTSKQPRKLFLPFPKKEAKSVVSARPRIIIIHSKSLFFPAKEAKVPWPMVVMNTQPVGHRDTFDQLPNDTALKEKKKKKIIMVFRLIKNQ